MVSSFYFDRGDSASLQQDALVLEIAVLGRREASLLVVCDGIGGLKEGEYAGSYVTMRIREWFYHSYLRHVERSHGRRRIERDVIGMLYDCNRYLQRYGEEHGIRLGTTMTMALLQGRRSLGGVFSYPARYLIFHAGDSRAYLFGERCRRLTKDDSDGGRGLYRCIGSFPWRGVQKGRGRLQPGESMLVCSDGFWRKLEEAEMQESLGGKSGFWKRRRLTDEYLEKRLCKLGKTARARGEADNQAAVAVFMVKDADGGRRER